VEALVFAEEAGNEQREQYYSAAFEPTYFHITDDRRFAYTVQPFARVADDSELSHFDLRALNATYVNRDYEVTLGVKRVFWGVTEFKHVVDIINQTDVIEDPGGDIKLGQPMLEAKYLTDSGFFEAYALFGFRQPTFPGESDRLRPPLPILPDEATYDSGRKDKKIDFAVRWKTYAGPWDIAISHFSGTSREPSFRVITSNGEAVGVAPHYALIEQTGLELQSTFDAWLWKLESISILEDSERYAAASLGFEYTLPSKPDALVDVGLIMEYLYDERDQIFDDDVALGARLTFTDTQSTEVLFGAIVDNNDQSTVFSVEGSRRLGENWKLKIQGQSYSGFNENDNYQWIGNEDYLRISLQRFF
jgi:hypothetical protein